MPLLALAAASLPPLVAFISFVLYVSFVSFKVVSLKVRGTKLEHLASPLEF